MEDEEEGENPFIAADSMNPDEREEVVSTNIQRLRERDKREVIMKVMSELLENLNNALPLLRRANHSLNVNEPNSPVGTGTEYNVD